MRIFILDDHAVYRAGLNAVLSRNDGWKVVAEAGSAREAFPLIDDSRPDLLIVDLILPGMNGCGVARDLGHRLPELNILMLTQCDSPLDVAEAFEAGVNGYLLKSEPLPALFEAIRRVSRGERYLSSRLAHLGGRTSAGKAGPDLAGLTEREREVFRHAADGLANWQIALELCISCKTVEAHRHRIQRKIGLRPRPGGAPMR